MISALFLATLGQQVLGKDIYAQAVAKLDSVQSVEGKLEVQSGGKFQTITFKVRRPNFFDVRGPEVEEHFDGKTYWSFSPKEKTWIRGDEEGVTPDSLPFYNELIAPQFQGMGVAKEAVFDGRPVWEVPTSLYHLLIFDKATLAPLGYRTAEGEDPPIVARFKDLKFNTSMSEDSFKWEPPAGSKEYVDPALANLLKVGSLVPEAKVLGLDGVAMTVKDLLKGKKGLLLNFWFIDCPPCMEELPVLARLHPEMKAAEVEIAAINIRDPQSRAMSFWKAKGFPFAAVVPGEEQFAEKFGVSFAPVNYLLDSKGRIVAAIPGFDEAALVEALRGLGVAIKH